MKLDTLICTVGTSGPVVTETVAFLERKDSLPPAQIHLITSSDEGVVQNAILIECALRNRFESRVKVINHQMAQQDIDSYPALIEFMRLCKKVVVEVRERFPAAKIGFLISGGRKTESVAAAFVASSMGAEAVLHAYSRSVSPFNIPLERARQLIADLAASEDRDEFYRQNMATLDEICFPPLETYEVISLLLPPSPPRFMQRLVAAMKSCPTSKKRVLTYLNDEEFEECAKRGFFRFHGTDCALGESGEDILKIFGD